MKIIVTRTYDDMSKEAFRLVKEIVAKKKNACLGLATGSTPLGLYDLLVKDHLDNKTTYKDIKTVNLDEYVGLDKDNINSYAYFMRTNLFDKLDINLSNTFIPNGIASNYEEECNRYNKVLEELIPDIQILGIGSDGHIAFNEPNTPFSSLTHVTSLEESTIKDNSRLFNSIDEVPTKAFTQGIKNIMNAKQIVILASGKNKQNAVYNMIKGNVNESCPASVLQLHPNCIAIIDEDAAKLIM